MDRKDRKTLEVSVLSQVQLVQSGLGAAKPGGTLTLSCAVSGVSISAQNSVWHWIRQPPGKVLEWMEYVYPYSGATGYASSLQGRATISGDTVKNQVSLQLRLLTAADTATYYCAREPHSDTEQSGTGTKRGSGF
uniref:Ig-like domain-containing protein n=1 Tax=Gopherus agassizii TaxID=38772 RepID=A0A452I0T8_9SAUR